MECNWGNKIERWEIINGNLWRNRNFKENNIALLLVINTGSRISKGKTFKQEKFLFLLIKVLNKEFGGQDVDRAKGGTSFPALLKTENFWGPKFWMQRFQMVSAMGTSNHSEQHGILEW